MFWSADGALATLLTSRSTRLPKLSSERANNSFSCSTATWSARWADVHTATTMHTMATATMTPIGTTTLKRARSQLVYGRSSEARPRAISGKVMIP